MGKSLKESTWQGLGVSGGSITVIRVEDDGTGSCCGECPGFRGASGGHLTRLGARVVPDGGNVGFQFRENSRATAGYATG